MAEDETPTYLQVMDNVFLGLYTVEMLIKIVAMGFFLQKNSYLRDTWNILDFIIVTIIILLIIIILTVIIFIIRLKLRCWVGCKKWGGSVAIIIKSCGIFNSTVSSSDSGNVVGVKYFGLHRGNRVWGVFLQKHSLEISG